MNQKYTLYLGSKSASRKMLLTQAGIRFQLVEQDADETKCDWSQSLQSVTESIAHYKMEHVIVPAGKEGDICLVLTADTLGKDSSGMLHGKPTGQDDARKKLSSVRAGTMTTGTAFCIDKKEFRNGRWNMLCREVRYIESTYTFNVPDAWTETYFKHSIGLVASGAIAIEEFGMQFLKEIRGSYSAIVGLPIYEVREVLEQLGFFN